MSESQFLERLLDGAEVEWKALGEVCDFKNGFAFKSSLFRDTGLPIIRITNVNGRNIDLSDVKFFDPADYRENTKSYEVVKGDILVAMSGATTGKIGYYSHDRVAYLNQRVGKFLPDENQLNNRYLYHFLLSAVEKLYILAGGGAQPHLSSNALKAKIPIPIPCPNAPERSLAIQGEIVRILDAFTELTAELTARKKQYNHYRNQLLTFEDGDVEWKTLGEVALEFGRGKSKHRPRNDPKLYGGGIPFIQTGDIRNAAHIITKYTQTYSEFGLEQSKLWRKGTLCITIAANIAEKQLFLVLMHAFLTA